MVWGIMKSVNRECYWGGGCSFKCETWKGGEEWTVWVYGWNASQARFLDMKSTREATVSQSRRGTQEERRGGHLGSFPGVVWITWEGLEKKTCNI